MILSLARCRRIGEGGTEVPNRTHYVMYERDDGAIMVDAYFQDYRERRMQFEGKHKDAVIRQYNIQPLTPDQQVSAS